MEMEMVWEMKMGFTGNGSRDEDEVYRRRWSSESGAGMGAI